MRLLQLERRQDGEQAETMLALVEHDPAMLYDEDGKLVRFELEPFKKSQMIKTCC